MAGQLVSLVPKRTYDFGNVAVGTTQVITVVERIDISQYIDCMVALRVHAVDVTGGAIQFDLFGDGYTEDDPGVPFRTIAPLFAGVPLGASQPLLRTYGGTVLGHYAALQVSANRVAASPLTATVSLDLILRSPDDN